MSPCSICGGTRHRAHCGWHECPRPRLPRLASTLPERTASRGRRIGATLAYYGALLVIGGILFWPPAVALVARVLPH